MPDTETNMCATRMVTAPDGTDIPVPVGGVGLADGSVIIRDDAQVQTPSGTTGRTTWW